ncbi:MAG: hypothetical protein ACOYL6_11585 [Bacteriovoracaceae bacterium]
MKLAIIGLLLLASGSSFAQSDSLSFEQRVNQIHPNESANFKDPTYLGSRLLGKIPGETNAELKNRGEEYCKFLKYDGGLLSITDMANSKFKFTHENLVGGQHSGVYPTSKKLVSILVPFTSKIVELINDQLMPVEITKDRKNISSFQTIVTSLKCKLE